MRCAALGSLLSIALLCASGCQRHTRPTNPKLAENAYPGELIDSTKLPPVFLEQRIEAHFGQRRESFSAVLQSADGVLSLLGLTPYGARAFLLEQRGQRIAFTPYVNVPLPFPPRFIFLDVHRTYFRGLPSPPLPDGTHRGTAAGEQIEERWQGGRLWERSFERLDKKPAGRIRVRFVGGLSAGTVPARIELDNDWFGYRLVILTLRSQF